MRETRDLSSRRVAILAIHAGTTSRMASRRLGAPSWVVRWMLPVKIPLVDPNALGRDCAHAISSSFSFERAHGGGRVRVNRRGCWLSRSTEVVSDRIPAQQTIVRSKEIALQKYTENAACKESKKTSLPWRVCVDRSRLHSTDWRKTNKKTKKKSALEEAWVAAFIFRRSVLYRDRKGLILLRSKLDRLRAARWYPREFARCVAILKY